MLEPQEADVAAAIRAHQRQHDDVFLATFERVDRVDLELPLRWPIVRTHQSPQQIALLGVGGDHADRQIGRGMRRQMPRDAGHQARLGHVEQ